MWTNDVFFWSLRSSPEDVSHQGILLAHGVPQLLQNCFEVELTQQGIGIFEDLVAAWWLTYGESMDNLWRIYG